MIVQFSLDFIRSSVASKRLALRAEFLGVAFRMMKTECENSNTGACPSDAEAATLRGLNCWEGTLGRDIGRNDTVICPKCGEDNSANFRFCGMCGAALEARRPAGAPRVGSPPEMARTAQTAVPPRAPGAANAT